jgi:limonene-1,2-epoxide hydrolase
VINRFYTAFQNKDFKTMQQCYAGNAAFSDVVFINLDASQTKAMWEMLCKSSCADFKVEFNIIASTSNRVTAQWMAWYTFSATGNKVINRIKASFTLQDGLIVNHIDDFSFYQWARQALGITGLLLGWLPFLKKKVQAAALVKLDAFMRRQADKA